MARKGDAIFDRTVLRPEEPINLTPNTRVRLTIDAVETEQPVKGFLHVASAFNLNGPPDWSSNLDHYLYGHPEKDVR